MRLLTINNKATEPLDYSVRKTAKAVVVNDEGKILLFSSNLIGGGVEENETDEEALHREALEEAGMEIEIVRPLGEVVGYRDALKQKYVIQGYLCKLVNDIRIPTTSDEEEKKMQLIIEHPGHSIARLKAEVDDLKRQDPNQYEGDTYQAKLYNRQATITFIKEALRN